MAKNEQPDLSFLKGIDNQKVNLSFLKDIPQETIPDVSLQPDIPAANQTTQTTQLADLSFLKKFEPGQFEIFGVKENELLQGAETVKKDFIDYWKDLGVDESKYLPGTEEEKEFFGFNTVDMPTTKVPVLTDKTGREIIDLPKLKQQSTSTKDFLGNLGNYIVKKALVTSSEIGDFVGRATMFLPHVAITAVGDVLQQKAKDLGEEQLQDLEEKLFGSRSIKPEEVKNTFIESSYLLMTDFMSRAPRPTQKQVLFDQVKQQKTKQKPEDIVKEKVDPAIKDIKEKTADAIASELALKQNKDKETIKKEILEEINIKEQKNIESGKTVLNNLRKKQKDEPFGYSEAYKKRVGMPDYVEGAIQFAANFNYKAKWNPGPKHQQPLTGLLKAQKDAPKKLKTRPEILSNFIKDLDIRILQTGMGKRKAEGTYLPGFETIRLKKVNDIDVAAHEIGHFLDGRIAKFSDKYKNDPIINKELKDISYDVNVVQEGFAEFVRLYLGDPAKAKELAPNFYKFFDKAIRDDGIKIKIKGKEKPIKKAVLNAQKEFSGYWKQDALTRFRSKIGYQKVKNINDKANSFIENLKADTIDNLYGIKLMEENLGVTDTPLYKNISNYRDGSSTAAAARKYAPPVAYKDKDGLMAFKFDRSVKPFEKIIREVDNVEDWISYIVAKSASELKRQNREKLFDDIEIQAGLKLETPEYKKAFEDYLKWNNAILDFAEKYGEIITPEQRKKWNRVWYVPFNRVNTSSKMATRVNYADVTSFKGVRALTGGTENLKPIIDNIINNSQMLISHSIINRGRINILESVIKNKAMGSGRFLNPLRTPKGFNMDLALTESLKKQLYENLFEGFPEIQTLPNFTEFKDFLDWAFEDMGTFTKVLTANNAPKFAGNFMPIIRNGKTQYYEVADKLLFTAIENMGVQGKSLSSVLAPFEFTKKLAQTTVTLFPKFFIKAGIKDAVQSTVFSQSGKGLILDTLKGFKSALFQDKNFQEFMLNGGTQGGFFTNESVYRTKLSNFYGKKKINMNTILTSPIKIADAFGYLASAMENANRMGEYLRAKKKGVPESEAIYRGKNISVDFSQRGAYSTKIGKTVEFMTRSIPFFRAALLSMERAYRGYFKDPNRSKIRGRTAMLAGASTALAFVNIENPMYRRLEDWDRDAHWHFFVPTDEFFKFVAQNERLPHNSIQEALGYNYQSGQTAPMYRHFRIPKAFDIGFIASLSERFGLKAMGDSDEKTMETLYRIVTTNYGMDFIPALGKPLMEVFVANKNFFTGRKIIYPGEEGIEAGLQGVGRTSKTIEKVAKKLNLSPAKVEALYRGYLNIAADFSLLVSDKFFFDDTEDIDMSRYPIIGSFVGKTRQNKYLNDVYEVLEEISKVQRTLKQTEKNLNAQDFETYAEKYAKKYGVSVPELLESFIDKEGDIYRAKVETQTYLEEINKDLRKITISPNSELLLIVANEIEAKYGKIGLVENILSKGLQNDVGALKKFMKDDLSITREIISKKLLDIINNLKGE